MIKKYPYIKPTRRIHDSGFRMFEVGYCWKKDGKFIKQEIGNCSDHIWIRGFDFLGDLPLEAINIDLTREGYIRFFVHNEGKSEGCELRWSDEQCLSTMMLKLVRVIKEEGIKGLDKVLEKE